MKYKCGYKYITGEEESIEIPELSEFKGVAECPGFVKFENSRLTIAHGYAWDGASIPIIKWFGTPQSWKTPSLFHDGLYQLGRESKLPIFDRKIFDDVFYRLLLERLLVCRSLRWMPFSIGEFIAKAIALCAYFGVRLGGNYFMRHGPKMHEAP